MEVSSSLHRAAGTRPRSLLAMVYRHPAPFGKARWARPHFRRSAAGSFASSWRLVGAAGEERSSHAGPLAALALDDVVALLDQALALAILAFPLLLDVGALLIGHD